MGNDSDTIKQRVASGAFEHDGKPITYEMFSDGKDLCVLTQVNGSMIEYIRNQSKNFRDDFLFNLKDVK